jgi:hypothetical protein
MDDLNNVRLKKYINNKKDEAQMRHPQNWQGHYLAAEQPLPGQAARFNLCSFTSQFRACDGPLPQSTYIYRVQSSVWRFPNY